MDIGKRHMTQDKPFRVLVIGDFMLDSYTRGIVSRISPEAPVPVMQIRSTEERPGGAGNVALNLARLGGTVTVMGRVGKDTAGQAIRKLLEQSGIDTSMLLEEIHLATPIKNRFLADAQQLLRVDTETMIPIQADTQHAALQFLASYGEQYDVIAVSDYAKGFLSDEILSFVLALPVPWKIVDPKGLDFLKYRGAQLIKPNLFEAYAAAKLPMNRSLDEVAAELIKICAPQYLLITRSGDGISLFEGTERKDFPVSAKDVKDVTGAGDTVLSVLCFGLAVGFDMDTAIRWANTAACLAIEKMGCVQVSVPEIRSRLLEDYGSKKIFSKKQLNLLGSLLQSMPYRVVVLEETEISQSLFQTIQKLINKSELPLMVWAKNASENAPLVQFLGSLHGVKMILLGKQSFELLQKTAPAATLHRPVPSNLLKSIYR